MCPVLWSILIRVRRGVTPCVPSTFYKFAVSVRWSVPGGGSSDTQVIRPSYKITTPPKKVLLACSKFFFFETRRASPYYV